jgi:hypothetical protein
MSGENGFRRATIRAAGLSLGEARQRIFRQEQHTAI